MTVLEMMDYEQALRYHDHQESRGQTNHSEEGGMNESMEENKSEHKADGHKFCSSQLKYTYRKAK